MGTSLSLPQMGVVYGYNFTFCMKMIGLDYLYKNLERKMRRRKARVKAMQMPSPATLWTPIQKGGLWHYSLHRLRRRGRGGDQLLSINWSSCCGSDPVGQPLSQELRWTNHRSIPSITSKANSAVSKAIAKPASKRQKEKEYRNA